MSHHRVAPYHARDPKRYSVDNEIKARDDALWHYGELAMFCLMWNIKDHELGHVDRCSSCWLSNDRIASAYSQGSRDKCPNCFGTTFEGGYRAMIIRPVVTSSGDENSHPTTKGYVHEMPLNFESTNDFWVNSGDYIFMADGNRFQLRTPTSISLNSGFNTMYRENATIAQHLNQGHLEDKTSVAYIIPPNEQELGAILNQERRLPYDKTEYEDIRAPLYPYYRGDGSRTFIDISDKSLTGDPENPHGN